MALVYLGLGTNLGNKEQNLNEAIQRLSLSAGSIISESTFYVSKPWGFQSENEFLNAVILLETNLSPFGLLERTQETEREMGREAKKSLSYTDRIIDIDILLYDNLIIDQPTLKIPHPLMTERDFVLIPLSEIAPDLVHPMLKKKFAEFIQQQN